MSRKLLGGLVATVAVGATLATAGTAGATTTTAKAPATSHVVLSSSASQLRLTADVAHTVRGTGLKAEQRALAHYWTSARMKAAKPASQLPTLRSAAARGVQAGSLRSAVNRPQGAARHIAPAKPVAKPKASTNAVRPMAYSPNYPIGHPVARTSGKVFFTSFGRNYVCSGTIVNSEGKSEVWTAGHCVSDGKAWNTNWVFVPNYVNGYAPYGYWYARQLATTTAWFNDNNDFANDVGAAVMYRRNGWRIADYLGGQGIAWNYPLGYVYAFGYPQAYPFNGQTLWAERGYTYSGPSGTQYMVNYMTGGSSGGGWLKWFDGQWGYLNGHNDFKYTSLPQYMYSPYYGNQVASLYNAVRNISS